MLHLKKAQDDKVINIYDLDRGGVQYTVGPYSIDGDPPILFNVMNTKNFTYDKYLDILEPTNEPDTYMLYRTERVQDDELLLPISVEEFKHFEMLADYDDDEYRSYAFNYLCELYEKYLPILIIDIVNTGGKVEKLRINRRIAETYVKLEHMLPNERPSLDDTIKAVQDLAKNGRSGSSAPDSEQQLYDLMMNCIDNVYYENRQALQDKMSLES